MRRIITLLAATLFILGLMAGPALAKGAPVVGTPGSIDGGVPHTHHVITGTGKCVDVGAVAFFATDDPDDTPPPPFDGAEVERGLHHGANASTFSPAGVDLTRGPFHGAC